MADQGIPAKGDADAAPGKVVGRDLLFQLEQDFGGKTGVVADLVCPGAGIVA